MSFEFATAGRVIVGPGQAAELAPVLAGLGSRVMVVTGSRPGSQAGLLAGLTMPATVVTVSGEPTTRSAQAAAVTAREHGADVVAAVGGGSVIDLGKAVAMLLGNGGDPLDYLEVIGAGRKITRPSVPLVAVPTTAGTGAEVTANAVLTSPAHRVKASLRSPLMIPRVAIVDPLLTISCPPPVTAASGLDALSQCLEPFVSVRANALTDCLAAAGLRHAAAGLRPNTDGTNVQARGDMACAACSRDGPGQREARCVHGLASAIGGTTDIPHGAACAARSRPSPRRTSAPCGPASRQPGPVPLRRSRPAAHRRPRRHHRGRHRLDPPDRHPATDTPAARIRPAAGGLRRHHCQRDEGKQHSGQPRHPHR